MNPGLVASVPKMLSTNKNGAFDEYALSEKQPQYFLDLLLSTPR